MTQGATRILRGHALELLSRSSRSVGVATAAIAVLLASCVGSKRLIPQAGSTLEFPAPGTTVKHSVSVGEPVVLRWRDVPGSVLLVGVGEVAASGEHRVTPRRSTTYVLISEVAPGITIRSVSVEISGRKGPGVGNPNFPQEGAFKESVVMTMRGQPYTEVARRVFMFLQDQCSYVVDSSHQPWQKSYFSLVTNFVEGDGCAGVVTGSRPAGQLVRRAFHLRFHNEEQPLPQTNIEIFALTQSRRSAERTWEPLDAKYSQIAAANLKSRLERLP